jgi:stalled ribosome alternative rescue factor ArfA
MKTRNTKRKVRSAAAKALACNLFRMRVVAPKKGKGSYKRCKLAA